MIWLDEGGQQRDLCLIPPPPPLHEAVEHFWIQGALPRDVWRVVPDLSAHVIFSITRGPGGRSAGCRIVGARSRFFDIHVAGRVLTIGARLRPGAVPHLLRDAASQLRNRSAALDCVVGRAGLRLVEQMAEVRPQEALRLLIGFLTERFDAATPSLPPDLIRSAPSVAHLARGLRISRRGVYDRLLNSVGLPPKLALRIQRLHKALFLLNARAALADVAARAGYSDQAHFTREATCLLGQPPVAWRRRGCSFLQDTSVPEDDNGGRHASTPFDRHCGVRCADP